MTFPAPRLYGRADEPETEDEPVDSPPEENTATFTRTDIDAAVAKASERGKRSASKQIASDLGFDSVAAMKEWAVTVKQQEEEAMSEQEKALEQARKSAEEAAAVKAAATSERQDLRLERAILRKGVSDPKRSERIKTLVRAELSADLDTDEWESAVNEAIAVVETDLPELFTVTTKGSGDGGGKGPSESVEDKGAEYEKMYLSKGFKKIPK